MHRTHELSAFAANRNPPYFAVLVDNNGNTATKVDSTGTAQYFWDFENRLSSVTLPGSGGVVSFKYDPFGSRIYKTSSSGTSVFAYDGDNLIEETNAAGAVVARYAQTQNIDEPLAMLRGGATSFYHADGLGSITSLSTSAGAIANTYAYDSFGKPTASTGSVVNPFRYTARESDTETGLYYYRARYYDPSVGRFISEDPILFTGGIDFYPYVENNPIEFRDALGLQAERKPLPTPTPPDPTPGRPVLVPKPVAPTIGSQILGLLGDIAGAGVLILISPMDAGDPALDYRGDTDLAPNRRIPPPQCPKRGCTRTCRADVNDAVPGVAKPGKPKFAYGTATASNCEEAKKEAEKTAKHSLGTYTRHVQCRCAGR